MRTVLPYATDDDDDFPRHSNTVLIILAVTAVLAVVVFLAWWEWSGASSACHSESPYATSTYACDGDLAG